MGILDEITTLTSVGEVLTVPEITERMRVYHPNLVRDCLRGKVSGTLTKAEKYGIWTKAGLTGRMMQWRRLR